MADLLPCPFCGRKVDDDLIDTLYPTGFYWREVDGMRVGVPWIERRDTDEVRYSMNCTTANGGCGAEMHGDTRQEAVDAWNRRPPVAVQEEGDAWQPIETAPVGKEMFVAVAIEVMNGHTGGRAYTSDPWCIWQSEMGVFSRWPHNFAPTHWVRLPDVRPVRRTQIIAGLQQQALSMLNDMSAAMKGDQP